MKQYSNFLVRIVLSVCTLATLTSACSGDDAGAGSNVSSSNTTAEGMCTLSADCPDGGLCEGETCQLCTSDDACVADYGDGATCVDGACQTGGVSCTEGELACACDNGTCGEGLACDNGLCVVEEACTMGEEGCDCLDDACNDGLSCQDGQCVACEVGAESCACFGNGTCDEGLNCENEVCTSCTSGTEGCVCLDNGTCGEGLRCEAELCVVCPPGAQDCPCAEEDACDGELVCTNDVCADAMCEQGELDCPCRDDEDDACDEGFTCSEGNICAECTPDIEGCPCDEEGECEDDLVCDEDEEECRLPRLCADLGCVANQLCQDETSGIDAMCLEQCADGYTYNAVTSLCEQDANPANCDPGADASILATCQAQNRACISDAQSASCGACLTNFIDDGIEGCRAAVTCSALDCTALNRDCTAHTPTDDAICGGCAMGFEDTEGVCTALILANCDPGADLSILADCTAQNRECVESDSSATCGDCSDEFALDPDTATCVEFSCDTCTLIGRACNADDPPLAACDGCLDDLVPSDPDDPNSQCIASLTCAETTCADDELCVEVEGGNPRCTSWPCNDVNGDPIFTQAFREDINSCVECGLTCDNTGEVGSIWPYTLQNSNRCICETEPDYYFDLASFTARPCDLDSDGWIRASARTSIESSDSALADNARCDLKMIDRFTLENEYQQRLDIKVCDGGEFVEATLCVGDDECADQGFCTIDGICDCIIPSIVSLYETVRNDDQDEFSETSRLDVPSYTNGERGRQLHTSEINPLTRACISANGDYNNNDVIDIEEWQTDTSHTNLFSRFAYFVELHDGFFENIVDADVDRYVIREKSRCSADFPVQYDDTIDGDYWQSCTRNRDADFDNTADHTLTNYDFAEWNCAQGIESCEMPPPLTDMTPDGEVPAHALCDDSTVLPPIDGVWRGMNHHSQFKCIQVVNTLPEDRDTVAPHQRLSSELTSSDGFGSYNLTRCSVACPEGDDDCATDCTDGCSESTESGSINGETNTSLPIIECSPVFRTDVQENEVGFAAVRYNDTPGLYTRGCIDEWSPSSSEDDFLPWKNLCPGYAVNPGGVVGQGNPGNFGQLICGCGTNYGGPNCDMGCAPLFNSTNARNEGEVHYGGSNMTDINCRGNNGYCPVDAESGGRSGYWLCGNTSSVEYLDTEVDQSPALRSDDWSITGEVSDNGIEHVQLCEDGDDCTTGWSISQ